jgi:hypothetical protein
MFITMHIRGRCDEFSIRTKVATSLVVFSLIRAKVNFPPSRVTHMREFLMMVLIM